MALILRYSGIAVALACLGTVVALLGLNSPPLALGIWAGLAMLVSLWIFKVTAEEIAVFFLPLVMLSLSALTEIKPLFFTTAWLVFSLSFWAIKKAETSWVTRPVPAAYLLPFIAMGVLGIGSVLVNPVLDLSLGALVELLALGPTYWLLVQILSTSNFRRLLIALLLGSVAGSLVFLIAFERGSSQMTLAAISYGLWRPWILEINPNTWGIYPLLGLPLAASLWLHGSGRWYQRLWLLPAAFCLGSVALLTMSRSALVGIAAGVIFLLAVHARGRKILAASVPLLIAFWLLVPPGLRENVEAMLRVRSGLSGRGSIWGMALDALADHPLFGMGFGGFQYNFFFRAPFIQNGFALVIDPTSTHNAFLAIATEMGIPAMLIAFLIFPLYFYRNRLLWPKVKGGPEGVILITCSSIMAAGFARALFESDFILPQGYVYENLPLILMLALQDQLFHRKIAAA